MYLGKGLKGLVEAGKNSIENTVTAVAVINLILAATALLKDVFLASYLGTSPEADAFLLAYFIPDTVGNNLLASALGVACVPVFSRLYVAGDPLRLYRTVTGCVIFFAAVSLILLAVFSLAENKVVNAVGSGLGADTRDLCLELFGMILPALLFFPLAGIGISVMQVYNRFNIPALAPVLFNFIFLCAILYVYVMSVPIREGVYLLAASIMAGAVSMAALIWIAVKKHRIRAVVRLHFADLAGISGDLRGIFRVFLPYLMILLTFQLVYTVERYLASGLEVGSIAGLNYAFRLSQFPLWVFVAAVSAVAFPAMSKSTGLGQVSEMTDTFNKSLGLVFIITLPLAICLFVLRVPVVSIVLQRGSFDAASVQVTAGILAGYSLAVVFQGVVTICMRAFLAIGRYYPPLIATTFSCAFNIVLDFILVKYFGSSGLGYGAAAGALLNSVILLVLLNRELNLEVNKHLAYFTRVMAANLPVLAVAGIFYETWQFVGAGMGARLAYALGVVGLALPIYILSLSKFKIAAKHIRILAFDGGKSHGKG